MSDILSKIQEAFTMAFGVNGQVVSIETRPENVPGWDSLGHVNLASCLEKAFGISLDVDDVMEMENVRAIVRIIEAKLAAQPA